MPLHHDDEQRLLHETARGFMAEEGSIRGQLRHWRDLGCKDGFGHGLWKRFAEMGFTGILVGEAQGGLGLGHVEAGILLEEIGRNLTPSPFLITAVAFVEAVKETRHADRHLPALIAGDLVAAIAVDEGPRHRPDEVRMRAERSGNGFRLSGNKQFVVQGASADLLLVTARVEEGPTLFLVEQGRPGIEVEGVRLPDGSIGARLTFLDVEVEADAVIGEPGGGAPIIDRMLDAGRLGAAAELVGVAAGAMDLTLDYLKQRRQFGRYIGEFQALQHRAAHLFSEIEMARAATLKAQKMVDAGEAGAPAMIAVAKAKAGRASTLAVQEGVQMHGGIGMTDEHDIGLFMKRDRVLNALFGDPLFQADRLARFKGY